MKGEIQELIKLSESCLGRKNRHEIVVLLLHQNCNNLFVTVFLLFTGPRNKKYTGTNKSFAEMEGGNQGINCNE